VRHRVEGHFFQPCILRVRGTVSVGHVQSRNIFFLVALGVAL
jgi:hypothetical protein